MSDDFLEALETFHQSRMEDVHTMLPGRVQSYDEKTRLACIKPSVNLRSMHGEDLEIPPIASVPVVWPSCADFTVSGILKAGDPVMLVFSESSIGNWMRGSADSDADDETRFSLQDAVAIPGLFQTSRVPKHDNRTAKWAMSSEKLTIGGTEAGLAVVENETTTLRAEIEKIWTAIDFLASKVVLLAPITTTPGNPCGPDPVNGALITAQQIVWVSDKAALGGILA